MIGQAWEKVDYGYSKTVNNLLKRSAHSFTVTNNDHVYLNNYIILLYWK